MEEFLQLSGINIFAINSIEQVAHCLPSQKKYFALLLAWDAPEIKQEELMELFRPLLDRGLAYLCAWGDRCENVHDAVDMCVVEKDLRVGEADYLLMTTWHAKESLDEALWFFENLAIPAENHVFADFDRFAVAVGNHGWAQDMERHFSKRVAPKAGAIHWSPFGK